MRLLVVDTSTAIRVAVIGMLEPAGHVVRSASDWPQALSFLEREYFDAVVVDPALYGGEGEELVAVVRAMAPRAKVIFYSNLEADALTELAQRSGADCHVSKRLGISRLPTALWTHLRSVLGGLTP